MMKQNEIARAKLKLIAARQKALLAMYARENTVSRAIAKAQGAVVKITGGKSE